MDPLHLYLLIGVAFSIGFGPKDKTVKFSFADFCWFWAFALGWPVTIGCLCRDAWEREKANKTARLLASAKLEVT